MVSHPNWDVAKFRRKEWDKLPKATGDPRISEASAVGGGFKYVSICQTRLSGLFWDWCGEICSYFHSLPLDQMIQFN